ncbi:MAG: GNAT family N-acetyltransferase [Xanthobacteraceae bacterium]|nr:GNAT family N-acetyltransferase [Xanthobacteraceae bacterium]MCZ7660143.1 GNAT family N-acetyltransferase [Xanthobacteraceae bacterium]
MDAVVVRPLAPADRAAWEPLWAGYQAFYEVSIPPQATEAAWRRFHDPAEPLFALGAVLDGRLVGIAHYVFHATTWNAGPRCYLNDLFTEPALRGRGVGRRLIEAVYDRARAAGCDRVYWLTHETNTQAQLLYDRVADRSGFIQYRKVL